MSSHKSRPTLPSFSEAFGEYQHSATPEAPRRPTYEPRSVPHQHPHHPAYSSASTPRSVLSSTGGIPHSAGGYSTPAPMPSQHTGHAPTARQPQSSGGQFSILRATHNAQPMSTASSSASYGGLSGNVRPLRPNEFSQYAVEQQGNGRTELRYICPQCQKGFDRPSSLRTHLNSHSGEKPHACLQSGCNRRFGVLSNMYRHMRTTHGHSGASASSPFRGNDGDENSGEDYDA